MAGTYELDWNPTMKRFSFTLHGMWDAQTMTRFAAEHRAIVTKAPAQGWMVLANLTDFPAQSPEIQAGHEKLMAFSEQQGMARAAVVVPKAVALMQMKRMAAQAHANTLAFFATMAEAEKFLSTKSR